MIDLVFIALLQTAVAATDPAPAATTPAAAPATSAAQAETPAEEPRRCRMERREGSNLRVRVCTTASEDEAMHAATAGAVRDIQAQAGRGAPNE